MCVCDDLWSYSHSAWDPYKTTSPRRKLHKTLMNRLPWVWRSWHTKLQVHQAILRLTCISCNLDQQFPGLILVMWPKQQQEMSWKWHWPCATRQGTSVAAKWYEWSTFYIPYKELITGYPSIYLHPQAPAMSIHDSISNEQATKSHWKESSAPHIWAYEWCNISGHTQTVWDKAWTHGWE